MTEHAATAPALSYELYPPRNEQAKSTIVDVIAELEASAPDYVSVTYNGTPERRRASVELIGHLIEHTRLRPLAHLTCVGETRESLDRLVNHLVALGVRGVLALRGDKPEGDDPSSHGELPFARYLVELIRDVENRRSASLAAGRLAIGVAAYPKRHPESPSFRHDIEVLLAKERAGANFAITQIYFDRTDYANLVRQARAAGVTIPIVPGIMPVNNERRLLRLCELSGLAPDEELRSRLAGASTDAERHRIGVGHAAELAQAAFDDGAPGLHLYTFNDARSPLDVVDALQLTGAGTADAREGAEYGDANALQAAAHLAHA
ncbi:methylenetetrahydrofolate reductase [Zhihengliuella halotolerans]|uniref:Methylenetetrahydrofolate reductase n=1 Tax=Zhihengliuella halotolerans TaxID=370736 RepID=A0A4Q8AFJ2_9MICC|nr:methylenetetrahydrofolate reductase [Zhihengliuella halotolerans]RZU62453.1 methylenetetrahydrofolate reductase (NADPH) [Zhihengliuella halotolerans]